MTRITDRELQSLRNTGNVSEDAADEIIELHQRAELEAQLASGQEPLGPVFEKILHENLWDLYENSDHPAPAQQPLSEDQIHELATDWFAEQWAIKKAIGLLDAYESANGIKEKS